MADLRSQSYDTAHRLNRQHERGIGKTDATGVTLEKREEQLLLGDMPSTIAR